MDVGPGRPFRAHFAANESAFRIPDAADRVEGIAGRTWAKKGVVSVGNLPDPHSSPADEREYATSTYVSITWLRRRRGQQARSLVGIPMEVKGRIWGVLVLDSRDPTVIGQKTIRAYYSIASILASLLEKPGR